MNQAAVPGSPPPDVPLGKKRPFVLLVLALPYLTRCALWIHESHVAGWNRLRIVGVCIGVVLASLLSYMLLSPVKRRM